ncbi:zinc ribbon domain-containing protein [Acidicapsa dinghuensis]|uniref:Zinc ribbon domain-containing protein n=1 Tax=Acidicapsa dinghuensis TaxID=2218256 RepID=A0ABW1EED9_9BACT|nr:C4-type zinc ribbon domain-containing protein [Acidicapsa dinghuensis]
MTAALKKLPSDIAHAEKLLSDGRKRLTELDALLKREELSRANYELEIAGHRIKAARFRGQLDTATNTTQATALEHEIGFAEKEIGRLEDEELVSMEASERMDQERADAVTLEGKLTETLGLIRARVGEQELEFREEIASLTAEREVLRPKITSDLLAQFDRTASTKGTGIARAEGQQCSGCRMGIRPQVWNQLRDGTILPCETCRRILYYDPAMEPSAPAKSPQSVKPGATAGELGGSSIQRRTGV